MQSVYLSKIRLFAILLISFITLVGCSGGNSCSSNSSATNASIAISSFSESSITVNGSTSVTISIANLVTDELITITNNNSSVITVTPEYCNLSATVNSCVATITGLNPGTASITVSGTNLESMTSETITVLPIVATGLIFGNMNGLIFKNNTILPGNSTFATVDGSYVFGLVMDSESNLYGATFGAIYNGFGAGKVFKYNKANGDWNILAGDVAGGSLDGSSVNVLTIDSSNHLYAGTDAGNVFKYINGSWVIVGYLLNDAITAINLDNDVLHIGTNSGNVFKFVNGTWQIIGAPDGSQVNSLITTANGLYASTAGDADGQVYLYDSVNDTWDPLSAFSEGSVIIAAYNDQIYAGTNAGNLYNYDGSGTSWTQLGSTPDTSAIETITATANSLYIGSAGTSDNGQVYSYANATFTTIGNLNNGGIANIIEHNDELYISTANVGYSIGAVYKYINGSWSGLGINALDGTLIYAMTAESDSYYASTQNNVYKAQPLGATWSSFGNIGTLDGSGVFAMAIHNSYLYAGTNSGSVLRSNTNNSNWAMIGTPQADASISSLKINPDGILYTSVNDNNDPSDGGSVWQYTNNTWSKLNGAGANGSVDNTNIQSIALDSSNNIYAATAGNGAGGFVWKHSLTGNSWSIVGIGTLDGSAVVSLNAEIPDTLYAGTMSGNVFKYNGITWSLMTTTPLDGSGVSNILFDNNGGLYATTYGGNIYQSVPNTNLWVNTNYGIGVSINVGGAIGF